MLHDVKVRGYDRVRKTQTVEIVTVDAASGDAAAEAALALRPLGAVVGVAPAGGFGAVGGATLEGDDTPPSPDDEDTEPPPSNRELAMMAPKRGPIAREQAQCVSALPAQPSPNRGPGRPRKVPPP